MMNFIEYSIFTLLINTPTMSTSLLVALSVIIGSLGNIFVKIGSKTLPSSFDIGKILTNPALMFGVFCMVASFPVYSLVLQRLNLSIGFPLNASLTLLLIAIVSYFFLKEPLTLINFAGIVFLVIGTWLISAK